MTEIEFDPDKHEYRVGGVLVPGVSQILADISVMKRLDPAMLAQGQARGKLVHYACELFDKGDLDEEDLDPSLEPYVRGWKRFRLDYKFTPIANETIIHSERWGYAGTVDRVGSWKQLRRFPLVTVDIKTGIADPCHGPQLAAYTEPLRDMGLIKKSEMPQRAVVRLQPNGHYVIDPYTDPGDWSVFLAELTGWKFKERHGLL